MNIIYGAYVGSCLILSHDVLVWGLEKQLRGIDDWILLPSTNGFFAFSWTLFLQRLSVCVRWPDFCNDKTKQELYCKKTMQF